MAVIGVRSQGEAVSQLTLQGYCLQALCKAFAHALSHPRYLVISAGRIRNILQMRKRSPGPSCLCPWSPA